MGSHFLLQGIFPAQGLNPGLLHCRQTLYHLSHQGSLKRGGLSNGEKTISLVSGTGKTERVKELNLNIFSHYIQKNSKWIKDLNRESETIKLLEENISRTLFDINCGGVFFLGGGCLSPKAKETKAEINRS